MSPNFSYKNLNLTRLFCLELAPIHFAVSYPLRHRKMNGLNKYKKASYFSYNNYSINSSDWDIFKKKSNFFFFQRFVCCFFSVVEGKKS